MGGFGGTTGNSLPPNHSQTKHIFGDRPGNLPDNPRNRQTLVELANDKSSRLGTDKYGNTWHARMEPDGSQTWVTVRGGVIQEAGRNDSPHPWDSETGLNRSPKKNAFKKGGSDVQADVHDSFVAMYQALDAAFDEHPSSERLREFASEANPFLWKGKGSADPAVYIEFEHAWKERFGNHEIAAPEARQFVRGHLKTQDEDEYAFAPAGDVTLVEAFDSVADEATWEEALSEL
ncbi:MAG: hypothetical protein PUE38_06580 [Olsenella sp.]|nr:hypothetical protein [Olsenella sp.]